MRFRLLTFGGLRLESDGTTVTGPPAQRRRLALLALLAASDHGAITREKAFGLLWPEQSTSGARRLLSESLYILRRRMGEDVIRSAHDDLVLNPEVLWSDVAAFREGLATGGAEEALRLYRGPFLDGFHLKDAADFDFWAETLRERLARQAARAMESLAESRAARGDAVPAAEWWGRLAAHDPYSSRIASRYMMALAAAGERARALQFAAAHTARLRADLGVEPDPEFQATLFALQQQVSHPPTGAGSSIDVRHGGAASRIASGTTPNDAAAMVRPPHTSGASRPLPRTAYAEPNVTIAEPRRPVLYRRIGAALVLIAVATAGSLVAAAYYRAPASPPTLGTVQTLTFEPGIEIAPSLSPDGTYIAYAGGTPSRIYLRQQGSQPVALVPSESGPPQGRPRWSPDGRRIAFDAGRQIFIIPALGGAPHQIVADGWSPTWSPDGRRIAYALYDTIFTIDVQSGRAAALAFVPEPAELAWSPDGRWIALTSGNDVWDGLIHVGNLAPSRVVLVALDDGHVVEVTDRSAMNVAPTWTPDGRSLLFISNRAGARDIHFVRLGEDGSPAAPPVRLTSGLDAHSLALSARGDRLAYATYRGRVNIWSLPIPDGSPVGLGAAKAVTTDNQMIESISVSPDRRWLYFTSDRAGNSDIWRMPLEGGQAVPVTRGAADEFGPQQSPNGEWLAYYSLQTGTRDIWLQPTASGEPVQLTDDPGENHAPHWSPDGTMLCYSQESGSTTYSLRLLRRQGSRWSEPIVPPDSTGAPNQLLGCLGWMPDGRHMVVQDPQRTLIAHYPVEGGALRVLYSADSASGRPQPIWVRVDPRAGTIYFRDWESIWALDPRTTIPRQIVHFDDPARRSTRIEMDVDGERIFFSLGDPQSDLFVAELSGLGTTSR